MAVDVSKRSPMSVANAKKLDYVTDNQNYRLVIQLGPCRRFRNCQPGSWEKGEPLSTNSRGGKVFQPIFKPNIVETGPVTGRVANGLISAHNQWLSDNESQEPGGLLNRQLLVLSVQQTDEIPKELMNQVGMVPANMVQAMVQSLLQQELAQLRPANAPRRGKQEDK